MASRKIDLNGDEGTPRRELKDTNVKSLKPKADGTPSDVMDTVVPQMGMRAGVNGTTFFLHTRFPDPATGGLKKNPTRRQLGSYVQTSGEVREEPSVEHLLLMEALTLSEARAKAREWLRMIERMIDPAEDKERRIKELMKVRAADTERQQHTVEKVIDAFASEKLSAQRKGKEVERNLRNVFLKNWKDRAISDITELDVLKVINEKKRDAPSHARNLLNDVRQLFKFAISQRVYGITVNPCANLVPRDIIGKKKKRTRVLNPDELFALCRIVNRLRYPYKQVYQLLMLTALRLNAAADTELGELDQSVVRALRKRKSGEGIDWSKISNKPLEWIIPAERMKGEEDEDARPFLVPLTPDLLQIFEGLPFPKKGDFLFSTSFGEKAVWVGDDVKKEIDRRMLRTLKGMAKLRGDDARKVSLPHWVNHDIRRTVRTNLSRMKITEEAREAVLAHARSGIKGVYDLHDYADEKREALELWAARLRTVIEDVAASLKDG
jgi:hypothetical protein